MKAPVKILHIDADYQVVYLLIFEGAQIKTSLPLETALSMLENELFDLILSEPQNVAVLTPRTDADNLESLVGSFSMDSLKFSPSNMLN